VSDSSAPGLTSPERRGAETGPGEGALAPSDLAGLTGTLLAEEQRRVDEDAPEQVLFPDDLLPGVGSEQLTVKEGLAKGGVAIFVVLTLINALDELETAALAVLAPDIRDTFGISDGTVVFLSAAAGAFLVLGAVPFGWLADRFRRGPIVGAATMVFAAMSALSGLAPTAFAFFAARFGAGVAKSNGLPVNGSFLADAYPIGVRGRLTALNGVIVRAAAVVSPALVGAIAVAAGGVQGWRWVYPLIAVPVFVVAFFAFRLPEPKRGQWEKADVLGEVVEDEEPPPISIEAAFARLGSIRTLKTVVLGFAAIGFGLITAPVLTSLYLEDRFDLDAGQRGLVSTVGSLAALVAIPFVGRRYDRTFRQDPAAALRLVGLLLVPAALVAPVQFFMPNPWLFALWSIPGAVLVFSTFTMIVPIMAAIVPYRLRGLGMSMASIYVFFLGATGGALLSLPLVDAWGPRTAIICLAVPSTLLGGAFMMWGSRSIKDDLSLVVAELQEELDEHQRRAADPEHLPVLQVNQLDVSYGSVQVLFDVGFEVRRGEVLALLGTNGAGKSTILRTVTGLITPERGVVRLNGATITYVSPEQRVRLGIASLAGGAGTFPSMTVAENLEMGAFTYRGEPADVRDRVDRVLETFPQLAERRRTEARDLSGGNQQILALGMAMLHDPEVLLVDELSLGLAPTVVSHLIEVVEDLKAQGLSMVIVEQSLNVALALADRAIFLEKGQVRFEGPAQELAERDDLLRAVFLGDEGG
jgi:ABC-type branched-subunit amino acid transport system ATPase component/predicted MFS family arabinose efflux permease